MKLLNTRSIILALSHTLVFVAAMCIFYLVPAIRYADIVEPHVVDIDAQVFHDRYVTDPDRYVFLDVRSKDAYDKLHAEGSISQPLHTLYTERLNLPKNDSQKEIVLICSGGIASGVAYSYLEHYGFRNIVRIEGGIEKWQAEALPVAGSNVVQ